MELVNQITKSEAYQEYLKTIQQTSSQRLDNCFACGLPAVWLYMKAIGLETEYFHLVNSVKDRSYKFKELFYLLLLTSSQSNFFPQIPADLLKVEISRDVLAAQVEISKPDFEMAFTFNAEQLTQVLQELVVPNRMIQIGTKNFSVGIMFKDGEYSVYKHTNDGVQSYNSLDKCVAAILINFPEKENMPQALFVQACGLQNMPLKTAPAATEIFKRLCADATEEELRSVLYIAVQAGLTEQVLHLQDLGVDFSKLYMDNIDLLTLAASQPKINLAMIKLLLTKLDPARAIEHLQAIAIARDPKVTQAMLATLGARDVVKPLMPSTSRAEQTTTKTKRNIRE